MPQMYTRANEPTFSKNERKCAATVVTYVCNSGWVCKQTQTEALAYEKLMKRKAFFLEIRLKIETIFYHVYWMSF